MKAYDSAKLLNGRQFGSVEEPPRGFLLRQYLIF
jgi:hypothetical protein